MASRPEHNASHGGASAPVNRCKKENPATSRICNATFKTASALRAREATKHQEMAVITTTFVHHVPGPRRRRSVFRNRAKLQPALITYRSPQRTRARTEESGNAVPASPESLFLPSVVASEGVPDAGLSHTINCPVDDESTPSTPSEGAPDPVPESSDVPGLSQTPGQPHQPQQLPIYECRTSRQHPDQPKALAWATRAGHEHFTSLFTELLARWGLTVQHRGTCLLVPEHLKHSAPLDLMALFDPENFPHAGAPRAWYLYGDHGTTLARAKVWHSWPRTGVELDNFTGRGPYKPMDASHLCHHEHCLIHVVLEPANINQNRKECVRQARFLRAERRTVPEECALHDPPCLMQVSLPAVLHHRCSQLTLGSMRLSPASRGIIFSSQCSAKPMAFRPTRGSPAPAGTCTQRSRRSYPVCSPQSKPTQRNRYPRTSTSRGTASNPRVGLILLVDSASRRESKSMRALSACGAVLSTSIKTSTMQSVWKKSNAPR